MSQTVCNQSSRERWSNIFQSSRSSLCIVTATMATLSFVAQSLNKNPPREWELSWVTVLYGGYLLHGGVTWALLAVCRVRGGYLQLGLTRLWREGVDWGGGWCSWSRSTGKFQRDDLRGSMMIVVLGSTAISVLVAGELCKGGKYIVADLFIVILGNGLVMLVMEGVVVVVVLQWVWWEGGLDKADC